jgi:hypothetical protein
MFNRVENADRTPISFFSACVRRVLNNGLLRLVNHPQRRNNSYKPLVSSKNAASLA